MTGPLDQGPALLFCPADRPERYDKAAERADAVIVDLEDAVAPADKVAARDALVASDLDPSRVIVRINPADTVDFGLDLAAVARTEYRTVMLAKAEFEAQVARIGGGYRVLALCETAKGVHAAADIASCDAVDALMWGAEDLVASLGGTSSRTSDGRYRDVARLARAQVLLAAGAFGKAAIDAVHLDIADVGGLTEEATDAAACGFVATACIHPSQVGLIRQAYRPSAEDLQFARDVLSAAAAERGVFAFRGRMVDEPVLRHARQIVARAGIV